ncbi:hypothetical protein GQ600_18163 [Phytophthora cactorum]|nr:hypothetical protein GQ600_18163 [Phytophthora cactorum]
MLRNLA